MQLPCQGTMGDAYSYKLLISRWFCLNGRQAGALSAHMGTLPTKYSVGQSAHVGSVTGSSRNQFVGVRKPALYRRQTVRLRDSLPRYISHRYWDVRLPRARRRLLITWRWATNGRALCLTSLSCVEASYASFQVVMRPHWDLPGRRGSREAP